MLIATKIEGFALRYAGREDAPLILDFIRQLARYEHMKNEVKATERIIGKSLFDEKAAEVIIGEYEGEPACFALFFRNISTFTGCPGIYLEDLFVRPEFRSRGFGRAVLAYLAKLAVERGYTRVEWACLDWNEPSIGFYKGLGALPQNEWTSYRLHREALQKLAGEF